MPESLSSNSREDIAKASLDHHSSHAWPLLLMGRQRPKLSSEAESPKPKQRLFLLDLPREIRLRIYDLLLVSRVHHIQIMLEAYMGEHTKVVPWLTQYARYLQRQTIEPAVLQTCRQIHLEAAPILYSRNTFRFQEARRVHQFIAQVGEANAKLVRSLELYVEKGANQGSWLCLLNMLPKHTTGLGEQGRFCSDRSETSRSWRGDAADRGPLR
ncbi:hypothetical protein F4778DRAFT_729208 [Xylariomycetidae sp. FL2044]|nr:hypothetical protein F4778DRAFT_729208 [Xylariomycetidae sp. FL2044]